MIEEQYAAWFRENVRFNRCKIVRKAELWESWVSYVGDGEQGSKSSLVRWLLALGTNDQGSFINGVFLK
jgi:hypothetical protein